MPYRKTDIIMAVVAKAMLFAATAVFVCIAGGCDKSFEKTGALYSYDECTVYPDSFVSVALTLVAKGDSMLISDSSGRRYGRLSRNSEDRAVMEGDDGLIVYLFNRDGAAMAEGYDSFTAYDIFVSDGLLNADSAAMTVDSRIAGGEVAEYAQGAYRWPVAMSDAAWGMAAATVSMMSGDDERRQSRALALKKLIDCDIDYVYDSAEGLFTGIPAEMDLGQLPDWADAADMSVMMTLEGNVSRLAAMRYVNEVLPGSYDGTFVNELSENISKRFWIPNLGMLSQTLYQRPFPVAVTAADNLVQAFAVATGCVGESMAQKIVSDTPMCGAGVPASYPGQGLEADRRRQALTAAMWAIASARVKNADAWGLSYGSLVAQSVSDGYALRMLQGVTLRTVFGISPEAEGLRIQPYVHDMLGGYHRVSGLKYRGAELTITVRGKGDVISTFMIDGELGAEAVVPADMTGQHDVEVVLSGSTPATEEINKSSFGEMAPPPEVTVESSRRLAVRSAETSHFIVYLNGAINEIIGRNNYEIYNAAPVTAVSFEADVSNILTGYASKNYLYIPPGDSVSIACSEIAPTGGRVLAKKDLAARHVESTRYKNARMRFEYEAPEAGGYYIRLRYLDGLGVVNKNRQYALRLLKVNGERTGIMVLPQRGPEMWSPAEDWATMCGITEPIAVMLKSGLNEIMIEYFTPNGVVGFDHDGNTVIPVALELIKR